MKKIFLSLFYCTFSVSCLLAQHTFSIVAVDPNTGEVGSAGASCINNSRIISDVHPGVGAIHTQALYLSQNQSYARSLMNAGQTPQQIIDSVVANDYQGDPTVRQYGVVDLVNGSAAYTGVNCTDWKGHLTGPTYSIQGNILLGPQIVDSMEARFLNTQGSLACRLMAALEGAKVPGADARCKGYGISALSSFLRVAKPTDTVTHLYLDLNVGSVSQFERKDPIDSLFHIFQKTSAYGECTVTGISFYNTSIKRAAVYPNPAGEFITVKSILPVKKLYVEDGLGRIEKMTEENGSNKIELNISSVATGMVFLKVVYENGFTERIPFLHLQ